MQSVAVPNKPFPFISRSLLLGGGLIILAVVFQKALLATWAAWQKEEYSHGILIPVVAGVLMLNALRAQKTTGPQSSWLGCGIIAASILLNFLFTFAGVAGLGPLLIVAYLIGFFILLFGVPLSVRVAGALGFLAFLAPLPNFIYYILSFKMQIASSSLGDLLLTFIGIPVFREGNVIDLGNYKLQVVEACSGLRYLFPLMSFGYLMALMYKASFAKRAILFLSTAPITILMNGLRIFLIGITVDRWGTAMAEGFIHDFEGWVVFLGCMAVLFAEIAIMQKIGKKGEFDFDVLSFAPFKHLSDLPRPAYGRPSIAAIAVLAASISIQGAASLGGFGTINSMPLASPLSMFPLSLGTWQGRSEGLDAKALDVLGTKDYFLATYTNPDDQSVNLYVLYYPLQDFSTSQAFHSPLICIPGGGWSIEQQSTKELHLSPEKTLTVNKLVISKEMTRQLVYFWYTQNGIASTDTNESKLVQARNALLDHRTDGAMIRTLTTISTSETEEQAAARLEGFLSDNIGTLYRYLGWNNVFQ